MAMESTRVLDEYQTILVKQSWPKIVSDNFWTSFYINLFERSPSYQLYFDHFARVPLEELGRNVHFLAHTSKTASAFDSAIELLETPEQFHRNLVKLGEKHRKFRLQIEHFEIVREVLTYMIEDRLQKSELGSEELRETWKLCATLVIGVIKDSATVCTESTSMESHSRSKNRNKDTKISV